MPIAELASELDVDELALRRTLHESHPRPDPDVLTAVVWRYGVDPSWLLVGDYDGATHTYAAELRTRSALASYLHDCLAGVEVEAPIEDRREA